MIMDGVREYGEGDPVELNRGRDGRWVIRATNEGGYSATEVDLEDLLRWLHPRHPELFEHIGEPNARLTWNG